MTKANCSVSLFALSSLITLVFIAPTAMAAEHIVRIVSDHAAMRMMFVPDILKIAPGDRVTWVNEADEEHDVVTFPDGFPRGAEGFQSPIMTQAGERFSHQFDVPGTYEYHCIPHLPMGMKGVVIVGQPTSADGFHAPSAAEIDAYRTLRMEWFDEDDVPVLDHQDRMPGTDLGLATDR